MVSSALQFAFPHNRAVKPGAPAAQKAFHHVVAVEPGAQLVAGQARFGDRQFDGADAQSVADVEFFFQQTFGGEVFTEGARRQFFIAELAAPEMVVLGRVDVDRLARPAVDGQVGLAIAVNIQSAHAHAPGHRRFENACANHPPIVNYLARQPDIDRYDLHGSSIRCCGARVGCARHFSRQVQCDRGAAVQRATKLETSSRAAYAAHRRRRSPSRRQNR